MPSPFINQSALATKIQGLREAKAAFQALPEITREAMNDATDLTVREIARIAKANLQSSPSIQTRALYNAVAFQLNRNNGRGKVGVTSGSTTGFFSAGTGVAGELKRRTIKGVLVQRAGRRARLLMPSRYAHFIEFGTRYSKAEPFMVPAAESQEKPHLARCLAAGRKIERQTAAIGMAGGGRTL